MSNQLTYFVDLQGEIIGKSRQKFTAGATLAEALAGAEAARSRVADLNQKDSIEMVGIDLQVTRARCVTLWEAGSWKSSAEKHVETMAQAPAPKAKVIRYGN